MRRPIATLFLIHAALSVPAFAADSPEAFLLAASEAVGSRAPARSEDARFAEGIIGEALVLGRRGRAEFDLPRAPDWVAGAVEFWLKAEWHGHDGQRHDIFSLGEADGLRFFKDTEDRLCVTLGGADAAAAIRIAAGGELPEGHWLHFVLRREKGELALLLDGAVHGQVKADLPAGALPGRFVLGGEGADFSVDEVRVSAGPRAMADIHAEVAAGRRALPGQPQSELWAWIRIEDRPARVVFDTGAPAVYLEQSFLDAEGIAFERRGANPELPGVARVRFGAGSSEREQQFMVMKVPQLVAAKTQGLLGWAYLRTTRFHIDWSARWISRIPC